MKKSKIVLLIAILSICVILAGIFFVKYQNGKNRTILGLTMEQKLQDYEELCSILDTSYPFWKESEDAGIDKEALYAEYREYIQKTKNDIDFFKEINYFLKELKGFGHLTVLDGYRYRQYLTALNASDVLSEKQKENIKLLESVLYNPVSITTYGLLDQSHTGFRSIKGLKSDYNETVQDEDNSQMLPLEADIQPGIGYAYVKVDSFALERYPMDKIFFTNLFLEIHDIPNLIIDLRENSGGSDLYWQDFLVKPNARESLFSQRVFLFNDSEYNREYFSDNGLHFEPIKTAPELYASKYRSRFTHYTVDTTSFEKSDNPYEGKIWILTSEKVYSASENFVMFCKNTGFAYLVGTPTGGDGGMLDPMLLSLPNSGLIVRFSPLYGTNSDGEGNEACGTSPDILISEEEDAFEKCKSMINNTK